MVKGAVLQPVQRELARREQPTHGSLEWHIQEFDRNPQSHGLNKDWYKFNGIGFLMNTQMYLLPKGLEHDAKALDTWSQQTKRDILGFCLEYLSKGLVFSYKYKISDKGGKRELVDPLYGNKSAVEMIDPKERGGVVVENMRRIQDFFLNPETPDGSLAVVPSPKGPSGLTTDDKKAIDYETSFVFVMQKKRGEIVGSTIKTDLTNKEYRAMIQTLTGVTLPFDASLQDFVRAIALIKPNKNDRRTDTVHSIDDVISVMRNAKIKYRDPKNNNGFAVDTAFEDRKWDEVREGVRKGEALYKFNEATQQYVAEFMAYTKEGGHSRIDLQKAVAATLLRVSQVFLESQNPDSINRKLITTRDVDTKAPAVLPSHARMSFGHVFEEVQKIKGCAGGGTSENGITSVRTMGGDRVGRVSASGEDEAGWFECPKCEQRAKPPVGDRCPHCQYTKDDFVKEHPELACA